MQDEAYVGTRLPPDIAYAQDARLGRYNCLDSMQREPHELGIK